MRDKGVGDAVAVSLSDIVARLMRIRIPTRCRGCDLYALGSRNYLWSGHRIRAILETIVIIAGHYIHYEGDINGLTSYVTWSNKWCAARRHIRNIGNS